MTRTAEVHRLLDLPRGPRLQSLRGRFLRALTLLIALVLLVFAVVLVFLGRRASEVELRERAEGYATLAGPDIAGAWESYGRSGAAKFRRILFKTAALNDDLHALAIYDTSGDLLFHTDSLEPDPRRKLRRLGAQTMGRPLSALPEHAIRTWDETTPDGRNYFVVLVPYLDEWDAFHSAVAFYFSDESLRDLTRNTVSTLAVLGLLALFLGVACAFFLARESLEPLDKLTRGAGKMAIGLLDHRVELTTGDEFEILSTALDQLAERLQSTIVDLEDSNTHLQALNQQLQDIDRVKSDLLANVSHELRTPLTAIAGYVEALHEGLLGEVSDDQQRSLTVMDRNVLRLRGMIDQLLSYSRMESGRLEMELRPFDLRPVAAHVMEALRSIHGDRNEWSEEIPDDLPEVYGDAARIAQVLENLLTNAVKFTPEGGLVEVRATEVKGGVEVQVRDTGIGIPPAAQARIYDRFFQIDTGSRRRFGGIGLGLAIVREILERHHSEISLESEEGVGTTFRFVLPSASDRTGVVSQPGVRRIVLIDDDAAFVQSVSAHLSRRGYAVETAATAEEGRLLIRRVSPHAILIDRLLPDEDGFDVVEQLREDPVDGKIPVVIASQRRDRALARRLGVKDYLVKPIAPEEVEQCLDEILPCEGFTDLRSET